MNIENIEWIKSQVGRLSVLAERRALEQYAYNLGYGWGLSNNNVENEYKSINYSNNQLRDSVEKLVKTRKGIVISPPFFTS